MVRKSLMTGVSLFIFCALMFLIEGAWVLLWVMFLFPGFILGAIIIPPEFDEATSSRCILLVILSGLIYVACFYFLDIKTEAYMWLRLLGLSGCGAVLLKICYDLLIFKRANLKQTIFFPLMVGTAAAIPSSICMILIHNVNIHTILGNSFFCGIFLIYPLWYYCMAKYIVYCKKHLV